ncbi:MAG: 16S rRNA (cytidine(1402)-2'-O)-methyltransferase [Thermodesulfobacteriota bacterium]|nr:16S rRNA (cytidine(1402)-2'-O)-methyltransferase [Thermodesulfobacteriota bacterium]
MSSPTETPFPSSGTLFVVATPIGNMEDITLRAIRTLREVDVIAAEDTRHSRKLLSHYDIATPLVSYHDHNKEKRTPELLKRLQGGTSIALVTDAGTPSISDPGHYLVREAIAQSLPVVPIPGASALIAALSVSGLATDSFVFVGFVPRKSAKRKQWLNELRQEPRSLILYESPKRLLGLMQEILDVMGDRQTTIARELTKLHEEILRGPLSQLLKEMSQREPVKGECTLLVAGCEKKREIDLGALRDRLRLLAQENGLTLSHMVKEVAKEWDLPRKVVYEEALKLKRE